MISSFLKLSLFLYAAMTLIGMAPMNIAFGLLTLLTALLWAQSKKTSAPYFGEIENQKEWFDYKKVAGLLSFACLFSLAMAALHPISYAGREPEVTLHGFHKIWFMLIPCITLPSFFLLKVSDQKKWLVHLIHFYIGMTLLLAPLAVIQYFTGWPISLPLPVVENRFHAVLLLGHHLSVASILPFPTLIAFGLWLSHLQTQASFQRKAFYFSSFVAGTLCLFLSYARTAWLMLPLTLIALLLIKLKGRLRLILVLLTLITPALLSLHPAVKERITRNVGISERLELWKVNLAYFQDRPFYGIGWLKTQEMSEFYFKQQDPHHYTGKFWGHAHNNFFEMLGGTGLIGALAFLIFSFWTLRFANRTRKLAIQKQNHFIEGAALGLFAALIMLHLNGLTNVTFWEGKVMHSQMFALTLLFWLRLASEKHTLNQVQK